MTVGIAKAQNIRTYTKLLMKLGRRCPTPEELEAMTRVTLISKINELKNEIRNQLEAEK